MALFKVNRGNSATLPSVMTDGYAYFCTDTGEFFIDYADSNGELHRKQINAEEAKKLTGYDITNALNDSEVEIPTSAAVKTYIDNTQIQSDLGQTDETAKDYVKGIIRRESLPKGFPYKDNAIVLDVTQHFNIRRMFEFTCENVLNADTIYNVTITAPNGSVKKESINTEYSSDGTMINFTIKLNDYYNCDAIFNYYVDSNVLGIVFSGPAQTSDGIFTVNVEAPVEIHRMSAEYLPEGVVIGDIDVYWEDIKDKPFGVAAIKTGADYDTVNLTTIITSGDIVNGNMYQGIAKYIVIFDGEYFECDSVLQGSGPSGIAYCGNLSLCGAGSDNGLPFCLKAARTSSYTKCYVADPSVKHTVEAFQGYLGIKHLDDKYISDNIARTAYVDEMLETKSNNDHTHSADDLKVVSYDAAQELTEEQKAQAKLNIGVEDTPPEVIISDTEPTDENAAIWINTSEEWNDNLPEQVQADLNQVDETAPDYVKGTVDHTRLPEGYPYKEGVTIEWDGNTEGLETVSLEGITFYKVSDNALSYADLKNGAEIRWNGEEEGFPFTAEMITATGDYFWVDPQFAVLSVWEDSNVFGNSVKKGTYFTKGLSGDSGYTSALISETIHAMAPEFLPEPQTVTFTMNAEDGGYTASHTGAEIAEMAKRGTVVGKFETDGYQLLFRYIGGMNGAACFISGFANDNGGNIYVYDVAANSTSVTVGAIGN